MTDHATSAKAEVVVGLTSYNDTETIGGVTAAVRAGLARHFARVASRIVVADVGSTDDTAARAREALEGAGDLIDVAARAAGDLLALPYHGLPGRARALHAILGAARALGAKVCVVVDASALAAEADLIEALAAPVLGDDFDFVSPCYSRQPHEGALTKGVVYPLFRAIYGVRLHQPAAGEFACSSRMLERFLAEEFWDRDGAAFGIDLWLTTAAVSNDSRLCEAFLPPRPPHRRGEGALDLATTVTQVVGSLFADLETHVGVWQRVRGSGPVRQFGEAASGPASQSSSVNLESLIESFRLGYRELRDIWTWILPAKTIVDLRRLVDAESDAAQFDDVLWARIVYDFAVGYRLRVLARDHLLRSLVPLYLGWFGSFLRQVRDLTPAAADERIEQLAAVFEAQKPYLIARWRWPERFRT